MNEDTTFSLPKVTDAKFSETTSAGRDDHHPMTDPPVRTEQRMKNSSQNDVVDSSSKLDQLQQKEKSGTDINNPKEEDVKSSSPSHEYYAIVLDSGPIIKQYDGMIHNLRGRALKYVTTSSVIQEIRDNRSRQFLNTVIVPLLDLRIRHPTEESIQQIITFSKQTGDYSSLSTIDLHVLALTLDMEKEGCSAGAGSASASCTNTLAASSSLSTLHLDHIRKTPKRKIGLGTICPMNTVSEDEVGTIQEEKKGDDDEELKRQQQCREDGAIVGLGQGEYDEVIDDDDDHSASSSDRNNDENEQPLLETADSKSAVEQKPIVKKSWANLTNPSVTVSDIADPLSNRFDSMTVSAPTASIGTKTRDVKQDYTTTQGNDIDEGGQFDDASEDEYDNVTNMFAATPTSKIEAELKLDFPSLSAAATVPYEGEDDENYDTSAAAHDDDVNDRSDNESKKSTERVTTRDSGYGGGDDSPKKASVFLTEEQKRKNLQPISKSGRTYNSFRKYKDLMKPSTKSATSKSAAEKSSNDVAKFNAIEIKTTVLDRQQLMLEARAASSLSQPNTAESRILSSGNVLGGSNTTAVGGVENMLAEDDDGQGWITSSTDIQTIKNESGYGQIVPGKSIGSESVSNGNNDVGTACNTAKKKRSSTGPPASCRAACATTDFAMQNVLLQMNLILLSSESGMRIRRLKSWVLRCGACFKIHAADDSFTGGTGIDDHHLSMKRLFCSHCGSGDMMQRISASVDGKTGRLKLHFTKRKQGRHHSIRGTKFSLPKPGSGNRYQGRELLLREDQLLTGAWNQKVKIQSGKKYRSSKSESIFGKDIASSVGCNNVRGGGGAFGSNSWSSSLSSSGRAANGGNAFNDIKVGFGARKNPNAAKGRERRGKKKKSADRACGMRRY